MKRSFYLDHDLVDKLVAFKCGYRVRARTKGHKLLLRYNAQTHTYHDILHAVREFYPHARMTHEAPDGDMGGTVDINLNDS